MCGILRTILDIFIQEIYVKWEEVLERISKSREMENLPYKAELDTFLMLNRTTEMRSEINLRL